MKKTIYLENGFDLLVSERHRVYINQTNPLRNNLIKSDVVNTLINDCCLRCRSFDQIDALIDNAAARYGASLGSGKALTAFLKNSLYSEKLRNLIFDSISFCLISNSCSDNFDLNKHSSLCFFNSDLTNSEDAKSDLSEENKYELTDLGFIREKNMLLSNISIILFYSPNSFLSLGESLDSNSFNVSFLAFLPNSTDHLISSCSSGEFSFSNSRLPIFCLLDNSSLASADQFTQLNLDSSAFSLGSIANVTDAIYTTPLAFNSSNLLSSLIFLIIPLRTTSAGLTSGQVSLNFLNMSSGTDTVILGILNTSKTCFGNRQKRSFCTASMNYLNTSKYVGIYKPFDLERRKSSTTIWSRKSNKDSTILFSAYYVRII